MSRWCSVPPLAGAALLQQLSYPFSSSSDPLLKSSELQKGIFCTHSIITWVCTLQRDVSVTQRTIARHVAIAAAHRCMPMQTFAVTAGQQQCGGCGLSPVIAHSPGLAQVLGRDTKSAQTWCTTHLLASRSANLLCITIAPMTACTILRKGNTQDLNTNFEKLALVWTRQGLQPCPRAFCLHRTGLPSDYVLCGRLTVFLSAPCGPLYSSVLLTYIC